LYSEKPGKRWNYIAEILLKNICGCEIAFTHNRDEFSLYEGPRINYSNEAVVQKELWVKPVSDLLFEETIVTQEIKVFDLYDYKAFYGTQEGELSFDIFAASFYLVSRYEEYLPHEKDQYGRFAHTNSLAFQENFLSIPLVNFWA